MSRPPRAPSTANRERLVRGHNDLLSVLNGTSVPILLPAAVAPATPDLAWAGDPNSGLSWISADTWALVAGGVTVAEPKTAGGNPQLLMPDGIDAAPSIAGVNDGNTGVRWLGSDIAALIAGGIPVAKWRNNGGHAQFHVEDGAVGFPAISSENDADTGPYFTSGRMAVATNGIKAAEFANMTGTKVGLGVGVSPSVLLHAEAAFDSDWLVVFNQTSSASASKGLLVKTLTTSGTDPILQLLSNNIDRFTVYEDGTATVNTLAIGKAPVAFITTNSRTLSPTTFQSFPTTPLTVVLSPGKWVVQASVQFTNTGDTGQAGLAEITTTGGTATIDNSGAIIQVAFNTAGDTFFGARSWLVTVTATTTVEVLVRKTGGAGTSTANANQCTIEAWNA